MSRLRKYDVYHQGGVSRAAMHRNSRAYEKELAAEEQRKLARKRQGVRPIALKPPPTTRRFYQCLGYRRQVPAVQDMRMVLQRLRCRACGHRGFTYRELPVRAPASA